MNAVKPTLRLSELVDIQQISNLLESHFSFTAIPSAILDTEGNVLVAVGWQDICVKFHCINPASCLRCHESDADIKTLLDVNKSDFLEYKCKCKIRTTLDTDSNLNWTPIPEKVGQSFRF